MQPKARAQCSAGPLLTVCQQQQPGYCGAVLEAAGAGHLAARVGCQGEAGPRCPLGRGYPEVRGSRAVGEARPCRRWRRGGMGRAGLGGRAAAARERLLERVPKPVSNRSIAVKGPWPTAPDRTRTSRQRGGPQKRGQQERRPPAVRRPPHCGRARPRGRRLLGRYYVPVRAVITCGLAAGRGGCGPTSRQVHPSLIRRDRKQDVRDKLRTAHGPLHVRGRAGGRHSRAGRPGGGTPRPACLHRYPEGALNRDPVTKGERARAESSTTPVWSAGRAAGSGLRATQQPGPAWRAQPDRMRGARKKCRKGQGCAGPCPREAGSRGQAFGLRAASVAPGAEVAIRHTAGSRIGGGLVGLRCCMCWFHASNGR